MSAAVTLIKVGVKRIVSVAPYETVTIDLAIEAQPDPSEKVLAQIRNLQAGLRSEVDAAAEAVRNE